MDPSRKRKVRLLTALATAIALASALVYTSFSDATQAEGPRQVLASHDGGSVQLTGKVVAGTISHRGQTLAFRVRDLKDSLSVPVTYRGLVPDQFQAGREVIVTGSLSSGTFVGKPGTLITKCPSKYQSVPGGKSL